MIQIHVMYKKCLVVLLPLVLACSQKEPVVTPFNEKLHINMEDLYNEVMEVDSVLINGELPIVCSLSSAIRIFGDTILTYFDYRFPFFDQLDGIDDPPLKIYVFKNALFSQWEENMLILVKLDFTDQIFITYKGSKIGGDSFIKSLGEFYNSYRVSMIDEYFRLVPVMHTLFSLKFGLQILFTNIIKHIGDSLYNLIISFHLSCAILCNSFIV